jgi:hypothetical protein
VQLNHGYLIECPTVIVIDNNFTNHNRLLLEMTDSSLRPLGKSLAGLHDLPILQLTNG